MGILSTTNYPNFLLENTFNNKYFKDVVNPAKTGTGAKPPLGQLIKNWNPIKAFSPTMMKTGPTGPGLIGAGITAGMIGGQIGDWAYKNWEPATEFGDWAGGGIYDLMYGSQNKFRQDQFMNTQKQTMQEIIRQAEIEQKRKEEAAAAAAAAASARAGASGRRPGSGGGGGTQDSGGTTGGYSYDSGGRQGYGYGLADGGLINLYRYGGFI